MTRFFKVKPGDRKRIVYIKGNQDMLSRHIKEPEDGDSDGPTFDVWDSGVDLRITPTIPQTTTKPPPPTAPSGPSHATGPTGTAGYSLETRPGTLGGPHWMDQTPFSTIDPATQHQQPRTIGRQQGWQTESTLFNATVPTLNERPHLVAHPGPPPMYNDGSSWHPITPTHAAPHSALGVPPYAQVAQHPPMAPHVAPAPSRSSVSGDHQNPTRRPPSHARFQPYTRAPPQSSRKRSSSQPYADILQRDWGYTSIYPERGADLGSQHPGPWGPLAAGSYAHHSGLAEYNAPGWGPSWGAPAGLTLGDGANISPHPKLQARPAFSTTNTHPRGTAYEVHAQIPDRQEVWGTNAFLPHESPPHLRQPMFNSEWRLTDGPARDTETPQSIHSDARSPGSGKTGATTTTPTFLGYGLDGLARSPALMSYMPKKARRGRGASRQLRCAEDGAIPAALPKSGDAKGGRRDRSHITSAIGMYERTVQEGNPVVPPTTTLHWQGFAGVSSQLRATSPLVAGWGDIERHSPRASRMHPSPQFPLRAGTQVEGVNHHPAPPARSVYAQTPRVNQVARADEVFGHLANNTFMTQTDGRSTPGYFMSPGESYTPSPSWSLQFTPTSGSSDTRLEQTVNTIVQPSYTRTSTYSALQDAVVLASPNAQ